MQRHHLWFFKLLLDEVFKVKGEDIMKGEKVIR